MTNDNLPRGTGKHPINKRMKDRILPYLPVSIWDFGAKMPQKERLRFGHGKDEFPARFRPPLIEACLKLYGKNPVLDPMMGSGTTLIEASKQGFECFGIDIEPKFVEMVKTKFPIRTLEKTLDLRDNIQQGDVRNLPFKDSSIGCIITSPPYWDAISTHIGGSNKRHYTDTRLSSVLPQYEESPMLKRRCAYSMNPLNIGNIRKYDDYLEEMEKAYRECFRVLKNQRFMVVVVKDLRRKHKTIPLGADTIKVCQKVGFDVFDIVINKMYFPSFWIVYQVTKANEKGYPQTLRIHEYILIFKK
jgi:DNA modification methylase